MNNKGYPVDFLYELKQKNNIYDIISRYVKLDRKGSRYWGCCPFHNEKTPSFAVMPDDGVFYCFGCKEHGDVISFVQKMESCDFPDAVKILAEQAHMEVPRFEGGEEYEKKAEKKERILKLLDECYRHYHENLYQPIAKPAQDYIKTRGFTRHELDDFKLGYSVDFKEMVEHLRKQGFTYQEMVDAGTIKKGEKGGYYDVLAGRLVFPIFNYFGDCVGFSARILGQADFAKYINSAETAVFQKSKLVYGAWLLKALKQAGKLGKIIIVEGQIDVIAMHRAGFKNTVACLGSALTSDHANILKKLSNNIVLCFDGDGAGQKATMHALDVLDPNEFNIKVVALPGGHDPDEILKESGKDYLSSLIEGAVPIMDYIISKESLKFDLSDLQQRGAFAKSVLAELKKRLTPTAQEPYLEKLRDLTKIPIDVLRRDLNGGMTGSEPKKADEKVLIARENGNIKAVKFVLASILHHKDFVDKRIDYFKLLPKYKDLIEKAQQGTHISSYYDLYDVDDMPLLKDCLVFNFDEFNPPERYFQDSLWPLAEQILKDRQEEITEKIKTQNDLDGRKALMHELMTISNQIRKKSLEEFYVR